MLLKQKFGTSDSYSFYLGKLGAKAVDIIANDEVLQRQWAKEHLLPVSSTTKFNHLQLLPFIHKFTGRPDWIQKIVLAQIRLYRPDILYVQDISILNPSTLQEAKKYSKLVVGQIASPLPANTLLKSYDLILSSIPQIVDRCSTIGVKSEYFKIGFDPRILEVIGKHKNIYDVSFVGSFSPYHHQGTHILERLAEKFQLNLWGPSLAFVKPNSPLRIAYRGQAWGLEMYRILAQSKIVINRHINIAGKFANNMRLYESTGLGALLITDYKNNLNSLFKIGKEVVAYKNEKDLIKKVRYYLTREKLRRKIAQEGQRRTLSSHSYQIRMKELLQILNNYL